MEFAWSPNFWPRPLKVDEVHATIRYGTPLVELVQTTKMERCTQWYLSDSRTKQPSQTTPMSSPNIPPSIEEVRHHTVAQQEWFSAWRRNELHGSKWVTIVLVGNTKQSLGHARDGHALPVPPGGRGLMNQQLKGSELECFGPLCKGSRY